MFLFGKKVYIDLDIPIIPQFHIKKLFVKNFYNKKEKKKKKNSHAQTPTFFCPLFYPLKYFIYYF